MNEQQIVTDYFNRDPGGYASDYDRDTAVGYSFRVRRDRLLELLGKGSGRVLDIGCGPGVMTGNVLTRGWTYVGTDIAAGMIAEARRRFQDEPRAQFAVGDVGEINAPDATFDVVVAMGLVEYLSDEGVALQEMRRVLKPGGRLLVSLPNWWSPARMWDRWLLAPLARLQRLLKLRPSSTEVNHREYRPASYRALLRQCGFEPLQTVAYNFRIILRPFDRWFPRLAVVTARTFESGRTSPFWFLGTGVIIEARKL